MKPRLTLDQAVADALLRTFAKTDSKVEAAMSFLERADSHRMSITASMESFTLGGEMRDKMADSVSAIEDAAETIRERIASYGEDWLVVSDALDQLEGIDPVAAKMLRKVYLEIMSPSEAAEALGYSEGHAYRIWKRGLDEIHAITKR